MMNCLIFEFKKGLNFRRRNKKHFCLLPFDHEILGGKTDTLVYNVLYYHS